MLYGHRYKKKKMRRRKNKCSLEIRNYPTRNRERRKTRFHRCYRRGSPEFINPNYWQSSVHLSAFASSPVTTRTKLHFSIHHDWISNLWIAIVDYSKRSIDRSNNWYKIRRYCTIWKMFYHIVPQLALEWVWIILFFDCQTQWHLWVQYGQWRPVKTITIAQAFATFWIWFPPSKRA